MKKYVMGIDNGGTNIKVAIFDFEGNEIAVYGKNTAIITPRPGYTERDMQELWLANCECIKGALDKSGLTAESIIGVSVCGHGKGLYPWGKDNKPAYNGIVSTDSRAWQYPEKWYKDGTFEKAYPQICQQIIASQQVSLLAWFKDNEPDVYSNIKWVFSVKDYIRFRLTGESYFEITDISGSGLMDIKNERFDKDLLELFGIGEVYDMLAPTKYSYEQCGVITAETSELTGLVAGTPVAGGMFDIDACAIAMNVTTPEDMCTIAGTWSINEYISKKPVMYGAVAMNSLFAIPGYYLVEECSATSAGNLEWVMEVCLDGIEPEEGKNAYRVIDEMVENTPPEESDVYFLPFLYGSNAHPLGKGAFIGLTTFHQKQHIARAVFEGVVFSHKTHIDRLLGEREPPKALRMAGGALNSAVWVQMFADILELPIETIRVKELGALGAAMAAAVASGEFKSYEDAAKQMVHIDSVIMPNLENAKIYKEKYKKYRAVSDALDNVWGMFEV